MGGMAAHVLRLFMGVPEEMKGLNETYLKELKAQAEQGKTALIEWPH